MGWRLYFANNLTNISTDKYYGGPTWLTHTYILELEKVSPKVPNHGEGPLGLLLVESAYERFFI